MIGLIVAFLGIFVGQLLDNPYPHVIASILIGILLAIVALLLMYESKSLLIGETADTEVVEHVRELVQSHPAVERARRPWTVHLGPDEVFLALEVQFKQNLPASELVQVIDEIEKNIHQEEQGVGQIFIEAERMKD